MPFINVEAGPMDSAKKRELMAELTNTASRVLGVRRESFYVLIKENPLDNWGVGGQPLSEALSGRTQH